MYEYLLMVFKWIYNFAVAWDGRKLKKNRYVVSSTYLRCFWGVNCAGQWGIVGQEIVSRHVTVVILILSKKQQNIGFWPVETVGSSSSTWFLSSVSKVASWHRLCCYHWSNIVLCDCCSLLVFKEIHIFMCFVIFVSLSRNTYIFMCFWNFIISTAEWCS